MNELLPNFQFFLTLASKNMERFPAGLAKKTLSIRKIEILSHPEATAILEEMVSRNLKVNFTQTLDLRYINREKADLLRRIDCMNTKFTRPNYYFSLNNNKRFATIEQKYRLFDFKFRENVKFVCMYGFDTTLSQDLERFRFLRSLPGAYVFVQEYKPLQSIHVLSNDEFFDGDDKDVDRMLDELVRIMFPQNMKSMEKYYKWVSRKYARKYGRLHTGLVDTIFRYNNRNRKGHYIATLAGTRN